MRDVNINTKINSFIQLIEKQKSVIIVGPTKSFHNFNFNKNYITIPPNDIPHIFVDGGMHFNKPQLLKPFNISANAIISVGDNDSYKGNKKIDIPLNPIKDFSDLSMAFKILKQTNNNKLKKILLRGFLGNRKDHEIINLGETHHFLKSKSNLQVQFDSEILGVAEGKYNFKISKSIFSIIAFEKTELKFSGDILYKIERLKKIKPLSSYTLSNKVNGTLKIMCSKPVFIFLNSI
ncbi:MAG: hypothetical protein HQK51_00860 [Oligoflexia bacterium]|nr:hypothetical protein [Oligoflexia bacterium]